MHASSIQPAGLLLWLTNEGHVVRELAVADPVATPRFCVLKRLSRAEIVLRQVPGKNTGSAAGMSLGLSSLDSGLHSCRQQSKKQRAYIQQNLKQWQAMTV